MTQTVFEGFIGAKEREQTVWTPEFILDAVDQVFPDGWGDAFPSEGSPATRRAALGTSADGHDRFDAYKGAWYARNFANPPYNDLERALGAARAEWFGADNQSIQLVPVRTRRKWWCANVAGAAVAFLKPITFLDAATGKPYACINKKTGKATVSQFPENLAALYWGERKALFTASFAPLSHHIQERF